MSQQNSFSKFAANNLELKDNRARCSFVHGEKVVPVEAGVQDGLGIRPGGEVSQSNLKVQQAQQPWQLPHVCSLQDSRPLRFGFALCSLRFITRKSGFKCYLK
eukprot:2169149-Amphidinium_carterae.1